MGETGWASLATGRGLVSYAVPPVLQSDQIISSPRFREALPSGERATAARLLGRPYAIEGALKLSRGVEGSNAAVPFGDYLRPGVGTYRVGSSDLTAASARALRA